MLEKIGCLKGKKRFSWVYNVKKKKKVINPFLDNLSDNWLWNLSNWWSFLPESSILMKLLNLCPRKNMNPEFLMWPSVGVTENFDPRWLIWCSAVSHVATLLSYCFLPSCWNDLLLMFHRALIVVRTAPPFLHSISDYALVWSSINP